jgi:20S proteasome alpha/beta subunit
MTVIVSVKINDGIVMASYSASTFTNYSMKSIQRIAFIGNYLPRRLGLANVGCGT